MALHDSLPIPAAIFIGTVNAVEEDCCAMFSSGGTHSFQSPANSTPVAALGCATFVLLRVGRPARWTLGAARMSSFLY